MHETGHVPDGAALEAGTDLAASASPPDGTLLAADAEPLPLPAGEARDCFVAEPADAGAAVDPGTKGSSMG